MALLKDIVDALLVYPELYQTVPFLEIDKFVRFAKHFKHEIQLNQGENLAGAPLRLPLYLHDFLRDLLAFNDVETLQCWSALRHVIWNEDHDMLAELSIDEAALFQRFGGQSDQAQERLGEKHRNIPYNAH